MIKNLFFFAGLVIAFASIATETSAGVQEVYKLSYIEREPGTDEYQVTMLVSDRYIRIDQEGESSGYIVYDDKKKKIYSASHHDQSVLLIKEHVFSAAESPVKPVVEYLQLADAPKVSGENIYNYRVFINNKTAGKVDDEETCLEVQLVENILPRVRSMLKNYQKVVSGQQVKMTDNKVTKVQTGCFYVDQIYNEGLYYDKGLPVQEWHSNERSKILTGYVKLAVDSAKFKIPEDYKQFSVDVGSKTSLGK